VARQQKTHGMTIRIEAATGTHIGDKPEQQDRLVILQSARARDVLLAVVADGMGGLSGGAMAAEQVISTATQVFEAYSPASESADALLRAVADEAHVAIKLSRFTSEQQPHSTIVAMLLQGERADWVHSGDSRLYHFRGTRLLSQTVDHSWVEQLFREGKIKSEERLTHSQRNLLVSCLGAKNDPRLDFGHSDSLQPGDALLLCSDGLWAYFTEAELGKVLAALPARQAAEKLVAVARARAQGGGDNLSLVVVKIG
jgi:serine/threonine protein phosphatase PrpC